jgi:hypothetical protein
LVQGRPRRERKPMAAKHPPSSHSKNPVTGKGPVARTPGNAGVKGPSNHTPKTGR